MNRFIAFVVAPLVAFGSFSYASAQDVTYDLLSMGPGNANALFYSLSEGVVGEAPLDAWEVSFDVRSMGSTARINGALGLTLYPYDEVEGWDSATLEGWNMGEAYLNDPSDWGLGAFGQGGDGLFDLGWGNYDLVTHVVTADSMYLMQMGDGTWKKVALLGLQGGTYAFRHANLDGSNDITVEIDKDDHEGKLQAYYNLTTNEMVDFEPSAPWDMVFTKYIEYVVLQDFGEQAYPVTGCMTHPNVGVLQRDGLTNPAVDGTFTTEEMSFASNEVGHDWKTWTGADYVIASDRCYFVQSQTGDVWRLFFTGYGGSATGDIELGKILESGANVSEEIGMAQRLEVFPNPVEAHGTVTLRSDLPILDIQCWNMAGKRVHPHVQSSRSPLAKVSGLESGLYVAQVLTSGGSSSIRILVQ